MKGFIVDATYRIIHGQPYVALFGRSEDGESFVTLNFCKPYFFIAEKDLEKAQELEDFEIEEVSLKNFEDKKVVKILTDIPSDVAKLKKILESENIKTFEADIPYSRRFLIDNNIQGGIEVKGDFDVQDGINVYKEPEIKSVKDILKVPIKVMSIDIETDQNAKNIYCISIVCGSYKNVLIVSDKKLKHAESFKDEKELLERFFPILKEQDPDLITGWSVIDFDLKVIKKRCDKLEVPFILGRMNTVSKLNIREGFFETSKVTAEGRQVIDLLNWVRNAVKLSDYKLETAGKYYLGEGKNIQFFDKGNEIEDLFQKDPQKLVYYNLKDSELVYNILEKSKLLDLYMHRSYLTGLLIDEVRGNIAALDSIYLKKLRARGYVAPTLVHVVKEENVVGAYVMESKPGIYDNIIVLDFKSLFPSLMRTFNLDPLSLGKKGIKAPNGATFSKEMGIMPEIIEELWNVRDEYRKRKDEVGRQALKIIMNSMYGAMASPMCRFFNMDLANAITAFSRFFIKKTAELVREDGYEVIYSDSITKDRFVTLLIENKLRIIKIEELFWMFRPNAFYRGNKDVIDLSDSNVLALTLNKLTLKPEFSRVNEIIRHKSNKNIFKVSQKYGITECSEDHSLMILENNKLLETKPLELGNRSLVKVNKIPVLEIINEIDLLEYFNDYSYISNYKGRKKVSKFKYDEQFIWFNWTNRKNPVKIKRRILVNSKEFESLCRLLGAYIAEGSSSTPETTLSRSGASIASSNIEWLNQLKEDYNYLFFNAKVSIIKSNKKIRHLKYGSKNIVYEDKTYKLQMMNIFSSVLFKCLCNQKSFNKRLPIFIFHVEDKYKKILLEKMIEGDGSRTKNKRYSLDYKNKHFSYCTSSLGLVCDLATLLTQLNFNFSINYRKDKKSYTITTSNKNNNRLNTKVEKVDYKGFIYDLSVEGNNMFVDACGNILLHNTDSLFIVAGKNPEKAGKELEDSINKVLKKFIKDEYLLDSYMHIEYKKCYSKFIMPKLRGEEKGAKKRYAGMVDGKLEVVGMEAVRGDWTPLAKKFQEELLKKVFSNQKVGDFVFGFVKDLKAGKFDDLLVYKKSIRKSIDEYTKITPSHIKAARKLKDFKGTTISYVYTTEGVEPIQEVKGSFDYDHYIQKQLKPIADSVLLFYNLHFDELLSGQKSLFGFK